MSNRNRPTAIEKDRPIWQSMPWTKVARFLEAIVGMPSAVIVTLFMAAIALASVFVTCYSQFDSGVGTISVLSELGSSGPVRQLVVPMLVTACVGGILFLLRRWIAKWDARVVVLSCLALALAIQCVWTGAFMTGNYVFNDTVQVDAYAQALNAGDMSAFVGVDEWTGPVGGSAPSYLIRVPYQAGMVWLFAGIYRLFGNGNLNAVMALNVVANMVSICCLLGIVATSSGSQDKESGSWLSLKITAILSVMFLPFLMSATFVYSNAIAFALVMASCLLSAMAWGRESGSYATDLPAMLGAGLLMSMAIMAKQTFLLLSVVMLLCWLLHALRTGRVALLVPVAVMGYAFLHATDLPIWCLEQATGVEFGDGQPLFTNITLGLTWSEMNNAPGWYSPVAFDCYNQTDGSIQAQTQWCMEYIGDRIAEMRANPAYATYFFRYKIASEWLDPTYQACWFSGCAGMETPIAEMASNMSPNNKILVALLDGLQTVTYMTATVGFVASAKRIRHHEAPVWHLMIVGMTLMGILVYLLWEAQAMYILPFAFLLLPMSALGIEKVYDVSDSLANWRRNDREGDSRSDE